MAQKQAPDAPPAQAGFPNALDILMDAPIGIFTSTPEGRFVSVNPAMADMYGYGSAREMIESVTDVAAQIYADPADRHHFFELFDGVDSVKDFEALHRRKDGSTFWASESVNLVRDDKGNITLLHGFITDITARKNAEEAERKSDERFRLMFTNAPMPYQSLDEQGNFLDVNQTFLDVLGYSREELIGRNFGDILHPDWRGHFKENFPKFKAVGEILGVEFEMVKKDGSTILVYFNGKIQRDDQGRFQRTHCIFQDVTDRKRAEEALRESEEMYRGLSEDMPVMVCRFMPDLTLTYVNRAYSDYFGKKPEELHGVSYLTLIPEAEHEAAIAAIAALDSARPFNTYEHEAYTPDGSIRWQRWTDRALFDDQGNIFAYQAVGEDITERKRAEEKIRTINEQLQKANVGKDMLISIIAHDLKSPMSGLVASTEMLSNEPKLLSEKDIRTLSTELHKNAKNTFALLEDLLQWACMSQEGIDFAPEACELDELVDIVLSTAQDLAKAKEIPIRLDLPQCLTVLVDQPMLKTVIRNVLLNAIKFTHRGGEIVIRARQEGRTVTVAIQDNGIGMNQSMLSSILSLEKKKRQLGTEGEKGTGLGLVLCKQFIKQHGGQIWVESEPGKGTTVFFTLPVSD
ncbi:sensor histidine kinase [Desulfonatronum thioautotrophicum]|uniref:sensor histidine kinase n=1 Tax=Desulfonatronum thioautotrophicum TaxID=617001 RepID=UPI0005EBE142|nr:PAS domain-containing sensor histidine kinase [Desulfonatronum thioautotrophicum]